MNIIKAKNYEDMSKKAAYLMGSLILSKPECTLGLATGSTPVGLYKNLIQSYQEGILDFSKVASVNLDEYCGLSGDHPQSYRYFMNENLFRHVNIDQNKTHFPNGTGTDTQEICNSYETLIRSFNGVDVQLLGLGHNGHIGFNEPADAFPAATHCVTLAQSTLDANARFFDNPEDVPKQAYTMGIGTIMTAKKILVIVSGSDKADILAKAVYGPITPQVPASVLQLHNDVTIIADEAAASKLN